MDPSRSIRMRWEAFGSVWKRSDVSEFFFAFSDFFYRFQTDATIAKFFAVVREIFVVLAGFSKFSWVLGRVRTCSDPSGSIRMRWEAFGSVWKRSDVSEKF